MITVPVSVVIPVGPRHDNFLQLLEDYDEALGSCVESYEYIFVLDGKQPAAREALEVFRNGDRSIQVVQLSRRFGDSVAISAGFEHATGDLVATLPCYYQIEPAGIRSLFEGLQDNDMVEGRRWPRHDSIINRFATWLHHRIIRVVTGYAFRDIGCSARVMRRQVADEVLLYGEQSTFLPILAANRGFVIREVSVPQSGQDPYLRYYGPSVYFRRLLDIFTVFFLTRFTKAPLRFFGVIGSVFLLLGLLMIGIVTGERLFADLAAANRPLLLFGVVFLVLGVQLFAIGLIGELIIFTHGRELKEYSVAEVTTKDGDPNRDPPKLRLAAGD
jgi:glycosyltransferase involved in cell wall biosynthesis